MHKPVIIEKLGLIWGRDAIYLDEIIFGKNFNIVKLRGVFSGNLCKNIDKQIWIKYELIFKNVVEFKIIELDFFDVLDYTSSFEQVLNSDKIKVDNQSHYIVHTYDNVIEVIATEFEMVLDERVD